MGFDSSPLWRISDANATQSLCPSYPKRHVVPATMTDEDICQASNFRSMQRFPSVVWKCVSGLLCRVNFMDQLPANALQGHN